MAGRCEDGYFFEPVVFENLPHNCRTNQKEIFGSVVTLILFDTQAQVLAWANSTEYDLSATIRTIHLARVYRVSHQLQSGMCG